MKSIPPILWQASPQRLAQSPSRRYLDFLVQSRGLRFSDYQQLWQWSVSDLEGFWSSIWEH
ncbi:MAG: hypothetical protein EBW20_01235, partial [Betaproteobacteria bacterium]|nr:hypothetical protein [Betaproteobacteria bacterium]